MHGDISIPIILGQLFLATSRVLIDVSKGSITRHVDDEEFSFSLNQWYFEFAILLQETEFSNA